MNPTTAIIKLKKADLALRDALMQKGELNDGYNEEMEKLHSSNAAELEAIMDVIGYPTVGRVGEEASEAAWLVIQHAISKPAFMKKALALLKKATESQQVDPKHEAYLADRIAVFEGKPQRFGTQFDWDENGGLSPNAYDDVDKVNQRRRAIGLNTLEAQTLLIRQQAERENQAPPADFEQRKKEMDAWRRKVGWVKSLI